MPPHTQRFGAISLRRGDLAMIYRAAFLLAVVTGFMLPSFVTAQANSKKAPAALQGGTNGSVNKTKFKDVQRAATSVKAALSVGVTYREFAPLLQQFETELELLSKPKSSKEANLVDSYAKSLYLYEASYEVWGKKIKNATDDHDWLPDGCILVMPGIQTTTVVLAKKYDVEIQPILGRAPAIWKDGKWGYIDADQLMQRIWEDADSLVAKANARLN
jgi:hypothetical protein